MTYDPQAYRDYAKAILSGFALDESILDLDEHITGEKACVLAYFVDAAAKCMLENEADLHKKKRLSG
jgi:hypothetical protein